MEKLTIEHLAPYLPYALTMKHIGVNGKGIRGVWDVTNNNLVVALEDRFSKPILRPMSDLTREIEHNGGKFVPAIELSKDFIAFDSQGFLKVIEDERVNYHVIGTMLQGKLYELKKNPMRLEYAQAQKLFSWHFDVFGLIEKGLGVDINTLK